MQAVTLMRVLIKDALTRRRTAFPRAFSHINRRAFSSRVFSDNVSEDQRSDDNVCEDLRRGFLSSDNFPEDQRRPNVSEDQIRLHFTDWFKKHNWCEEHGRTYASAEEREELFPAFNKAYEAAVQRDPDPNISDVYNLADLIVAFTDPDSKSPIQTPKERMMIDSIDGRKKGLSPIRPVVVRKRVSKSPNKKSVLLDHLIDDGTTS